MDNRITITDLRFPFPAYTLEGLEDGNFIGDIKFSDHNESVVNRWKSEAIKLEEELKNINLENFMDVIVIIGGYSFSPESRETNIWSSLKKPHTVSTRKRLFLIILPESEGDITDQIIKRYCFGDGNDTFKIYRTLFPCLAQKNIYLNLESLGKQINKYNNSDKKLIDSITRSIKSICKNIIEFNKNIDDDDYDKTKNLIFLNDAVVIHRKRTGQFISAKKKLSKYIYPRSLDGIDDMVKEILNFYFFESIWSTFDGLITVLNKEQEQDLSNIIFVQNQYKEGESKKQIILLGSYNSRYPLEYYNSNSVDLYGDERKYYKKYLKYKTKYLQLKKRINN